MRFCRRIAGRVRVRAKVIQRLGGIDPLRIRLEREMRRTGLIGYPFLYRCVLGSKRRVGMLLLMMMQRYLFAIS